MWNVVHTRELVLFWLTPPSLLLCRVVFWNPFVGQGLICVDCSHRKLPPTSHRRTGIQVFPQRAQWLPLWEFRGSLFPHLVSDQIGGVTDFASTSTCLSSLFSYRYGFRNPLATQLEWQGRPTLRMRKLPFQIQGHAGSREAF